MSDWRTDPLPEGEPGYVIESAWRHSVPLTHKWDPGLGRWQGDGYMEPGETCDGPLLAWRRVVVPPERTALGHIEMLLRGEPLTEDMGPHARAVEQLRDELKRAIEHIKGNEGDTTYPSFGDVWSVVQRELPLTVPAGAPTLEEE